MTSERDDILGLARALERAECITVSGSGDREPDPTVSKLGRKWISQGLRMLAKSKRVTKGAGHGE